MSEYEYKIGDKVELLSIDQYDMAYKLKVGDIGIITYLGYDRYCRVAFSNAERIVYYDQIKLVEEQIENPQSKEKFVKCIDNKGNAFNVLELNKLYQVIDEDIIYYELKDNATFWNKSRFEEIPNPQNLVKSSVSEPLKSNKLELLMPVLDIIERLQELEVDKDNIEEMIARIESDEAIESSNRWYELKIQELEYENSKLQKENVDLYSYITKISEMTRTCIIDRL